MALNDRDLAILQEIVSSRGKCLYSKRCLECPFRSKCLPEFLNFIPPTANQRLNMALDVIAYHQLLDDSNIAEEVQFKDDQYTRK
jgi:hypothetical protein